MSKWLTPILAVTVLAACEDDTDPYNLLRDVRVLAIRADPPELPPMTATTLDALVWVSPEVTDSLAYKWSWCPFVGPASEGSPCALTEEELNAQLELPPGTIPFDLGDAETASFINLISPEALEAICTPPADAPDLPEFVVLPDCREGLEVTIRLELSAGGQRVETIRGLRLLLAAPMTANTNPSLGDVRAVVDPGEESAAALIPADGSGALQLDRDYKLFVDVPDTAADTFTPVDAAFGEESPQPRLESLFLTWFVTEGDTDTIRTSFIDGDVPIDILRENTWMLPRRDEIDRDTGELILVIRDERGGVGWTERDVAFSAGGTP